jgi:hypothetical protein
MENNAQKEYARLKLQQPTQQPTIVPPQEKANLDFLSKLEALNGNKIEEMNSVKANKQFNALPANRPSVYNPAWGANVKTN